MNLHIFSSVISMPTHANCTTCLIFLSPGIRYIVCSDLIINKKALFLKHLFNPLCVLLFRSPFTHFPLYISIFFLVLSKFVSLSFFPEFSFSFNFYFVFSFFSDNFFPINDMLCLFAF